MGVDTAEIAALVLYVPVAACLAWFAGNVIAIEDWWGDTRRAIEDRIYRPAPVNAHGVPTGPSMGDRVRANHPDADDFWHRVRPWYPFGGEDKAPLRLKPRRWHNRLATVARGKFGDMIGCPRCSGWWGSLLLGTVLMAWAGPWDLSWGWLAAHMAGWGIARRIDWATH